MTKIMLTVCAHIQFYGSLNGGSRLENIGKRIQDALARAGKSSSDLAVALKVSDAEAQQMLAGNGSMTLAQLVAISRMTGVSVFWLATGEPLHDSDD